MTNERNERRARLRDANVTISNAGLHGIRVDLRAELEASERDRGALTRAWQQVDISEHRVKELLWYLAEATCIIDLMLAECSVPCEADTYTVNIECSITHLSPELADRACRLFNDDCRTLPIPSRQPEDVSAKVAALEDMLDQAYYKAERECYELRRQLWDMACEAARERKPDDECECGTEKQPGFRSCFICSLLGK